MFGINYQTQRSFTNKMMVILCGLAAVVAVVFMRSSSRGPEDELMNGAITRAQTLP